MIFAFSLQAQDVNNRDVQWHGFLTQGYIKTSDNSFLGDSEKGSFDLTELGLSASWRASEKLLLAAQLLSRNAGDMYDASPSFDFLLADYRLFSAVTGIAGVRVGRIKNALGLYNETRDVAFTRPGFLLPQVIYFGKVRNLVLSADGVMLYRDIYTDNGNYSFTAGGGRSRVDTNVEIAYLGADRAGELESDGATWLLSGFYTTADERLKLGLSGAVSSMEYSPGSGDFLQAGRTDFDYWIASFQYNWEKWTLSAEYMQEPIEWRQYGPFFPDQKATAEGYFLQTAFRLKPDVEWMFRYEEGFADKDDRRGQQASISSAGAIPSFTQFSRIITTGLRWDYSPSIMLRAELQFHEGTFVLSSRENVNPADLRKDWNQFSVLASYRF
jgi:hypothetical protein